MDVGNVQYDLYSLLLRMFKLFMFSIVKFRNMSREIQSEINVAP